MKITNSKVKAGRYTKNTTKDTGSFKQKTSGYAQHISIYTLSLVNHNTNKMTPEFRQVQTKKADPRY